MKKLIILLSILSISIQSIGQDNEKELGRVRKINGVEVYVMNEPLRAYDILDEAGQGLHLNLPTTLSGGIIQLTIEQRVEEFANNAKKKYDKVDAIIYTTGYKVSAIKFKDVATDKNSGIAKVSIMKGKPLFVMCEPFLPFEVLKSKGYGMKWRAFFTSNIIVNSIEEDTENIVKRLESENEADAFF